MESNYYAVIPADVRYDTTISNDAKMLYAEISALANKDGYCFATNQHFEEMFNVSCMTIDRRLGELIRAKHIHREIIKDENKRIVQRRLYLSSKMMIPILKNEDTPILKFDEENNINKELNNINNKKEKYIKKKEPPTLDEIKEYVNEKNLNVEAQTFFDFYEAGGWHDSQGKPVKNWKQKALMWDKKAVRPAPKERYTLDEMDVKQADIESIRKKMFNK